MGNRLIKHLFVSQNHQHFFSRVLFSYKTISLLINLRAAFNRFRSPVLCYSSVKILLIT